MPSTDRGPHEIAPSLALSIDFPSGDKGALSRTYADQVTLLILFVKVLWGLASAELTSWPLTHPTLQTRSRTHSFLNLPWFHVLVLYPYARLTGRLLLLLPSNKLLFIHQSPTSMSPFLSRQL